MTHEKWIMTYDKWLLKDEFLQMTYDNNIWQMTYEKWLMTNDLWQMTYNEWHNKWKNLFNFTHIEGLK